MKYVVVLGDGMADDPVPQLGGKTPLAVAKKPHMDALAKQAELGMAKTVPDGMKPGSDTANLSVMGYDPRKYYTGRSPLEAVSAGVALEDTDIAFRANLVTLKGDGAYETRIMEDYSSDEISTEEARILIRDLAAKLDTDILHLHPGFSYRHILVWNNGPLSFELTPPHDISDKQITDFLPKGEQADVILNLMKKSAEILKDHPVNLARIQSGKRPATSLWVWGEGRKAVLPPFESLYHTTGGVVSAVDLIKGIGISAGLQVPEVDGATGNIHTNFDGKAIAAIDILKKRDFVYIHLEAPDECGHRGEIENKVRSIELIDQKIVGPVLDYLQQAKEDFRMLIMPDHPTPLSVRTHVADPVPYLLYDSTKPVPSGKDVYTEQSCKETGLFLEKGCTMMGKLILGS